MADSWNKKEREKKRKLEKAAKEEKKQSRKDKPRDSQSLDSMMAYIDENGNLTTTPPDPQKIISTNLEDIMISVPKSEKRDSKIHIQEGKLSSFSHSKGFGFIKVKESGQSIFVHANELEENLTESDTVCFEIKNGPKGLYAVNVKKSD